MSEKYLTQGRDWTAFDYKDYCDTGPHDPFCGHRVDGPVMVRLADGTEKLACFYTRLIGGFEHDVGKVTHWRWIRADDCLRINAAVSGSSPTPEALGTESG
jgi:hypothetical protein